MSDEEMKVRHIHDYGVDLDLNGLQPDWPVKIVPMKVFKDDDDVVSDQALVIQYIAAYRAHGPWALPPVVCVGDTGWQIAGAHRMRAAYLASLAWIPAFVVEVPKQ